MRPVRLLSLVLAAGLVASGSAAASAATAAPAPTAAVPAAGSSTSALTLLTLSAGTTQLRAGVLELLAETLADPSASATVTPLLVGSTPYGRQTVSSGGPTSVPSRDSAALVPALAGLVSAATPAFAASAATTPSSATSQVGTTGLGAVSLLGLPLELDGTVGAVSTVAGTGSTGEQVLAVTDLALPSVADLLAKLGVDLSALPVEVLYELLDALDLVTTTVTQLKSQLDAAVAPLQTQIDGAQGAVDDASATLLAETAKLAPAQADLSAATAALAPLQAAVTSANATLTTRQQQLTTALGGITLAQYQALLPAAKALLAPVVEPALAAVTSATTAVDQATAALAAAETVEDVARAAVAAVQAAIDLAQDLLDAALAALDTVLASVQPLIDSLVGAVTAVLDGTPLVSLDALEVVTRTTVTSAAAGGQTAEVIGGEVTGLSVLGTDVLDDVLGVSTVDLLDLTATQLGAVNGLVDTLTGTLSSVLSTVPGFPTLQVPAPQVELLRKVTETGVADGFGTARAGVELLTVSLPAITVPLGLQLPDAATLPAFRGVLPAGTVRTSAVGDLLSTPVSLGIGSLGPQASFRPAVAATGTPTTGTPTTGTPTTGTPTAGAPVPTRRNLPRTGPEALVAVAGLALLGAAAVLRRRRELPEL